MRFVEWVRESLDSVLADSGLPWNQNGPDPAGTAVLYCGPAAPYLDRFPSLAGEGWVGHVSCVDVIVTGRDRVIASVTVEGEALADLLRRVGASERAAEVEGVLNEKSASALPIIRGALLKLYG